MLLSLLAPAAFAAADTAETRAALDDITRQLNDLDVWLGSAERKRAQWQRDIQASDREVATLSRRVDASAATLTRLRQEIEGLQAQRTELEARRHSQAQQIGDHLASAHRLNGDDFVKLLLNQQSPETMNRMARYHEYFAAARLETLEAYKATLRDMQTNAQRLEAEAARAEQQQTTLRQEQEKLVATRDERKRLLGRLTSETRDKEAERQRLGADQERLEKLLAELERRSQTLDGRAFAARKGSLPWPLVARVQNAFGQPRAEGRLTWHGLLLAAEEGTPVTAVFRGRVVFADWLRGFGLLTIVDHGSGYMTLYGHADALAKNVGDWVESGEVLARAGRSGGVTSTGLYFEIRQDGQAQDPIGWLDRR